MYKEIIMRSFFKFITEVKVPASESFVPIVHDWIKGDKKPGFRFRGLLPNLEAGLPSIKKAQAAAPEDEYEGLRKQTVKDKLAAGEQAAPPGGGRVMAMRATSPGDEKRIEALTHARRRPEGGGDLSAAEKARVDSEIEKMNANIAKEVDRRSRSR